MSYKGLQLNKAKINNTIQEYNPDAVITITEKSPVFHQYHIELDGEPKAQLDIYYTVNGKVTLNPVSTKNVDLADKIAQHVISTCTYEHPASRTLYTKQITQDHFDVILEFFTDLKVNVSAPVNLPNGVQYKLTAPGGGDIYLNRYNSGSLYIQGENLYLKWAMIEVLTEILPFKDVIAMQLATIQVPASVDDVLEELKIALPTAHLFLGDTLTAIISPAIVLKKIQATLADYSYIVYPALRGLEGFIKKMFKDCGIVIGDNFGGYVSYDDATDTATLSADHHHLFNANQIVAIQEAYKYYKKNRHGLFHVDGTIDSTRIIDDQEDAQDILAEIFEIIEASNSYYIKAV
ncbi:hypothetical protein DYU05_06265 [Mucilaginibacter terrenus]|uniref:Bacterial toxin RNase RnlA/LsoA N-terminal domain-containing protein n=1 Tax=Mucilaginibacter terrenus TaxID=2482727 RepID=A0A3E2NW29_9SPHI|nr:RNase LS family HEPN domain-containing protein [Mucilaginibacter terrenus]RFZ85202.1 hypothetical protein DYU05_06265 [Mucilaginibacter terrenus]